jgi:hypothetical protein
MAKRRTATGLDDEISGVYALGLDDFTRARNEAAKRLRGAGEAEAARAVRALRKPSRAASAINHAVRAEPEATERLIAAADELARAQETALTGGHGGDELKAAIAAHNAAVEELVDAVAEQLAGERSAAVIDRARETLRAVAGDDELREELAAGRVTSDREAVGFGGDVPARTPRRQAKAGRRAKAARPAEAGKPDPAAGRRLAQARKAAKQAKRALDTATKRAAEAERRRDRAREKLEAARERLDQAQGELRERESELGRAEAALSDLER